MFLFLWACTGDKDSAATEPTLNTDIQPIFNLNCTGCHSGSAAAEGLDLSEGNARAELVGAISFQVPDLMQVSPGDPDNSYLWLKLNNTQQAAGGTGTQMPPELPLSDSDLSLIEDWITSGAH